MMKKIFLIILPIACIVVLTPFLLSSDSQEDVVAKKPYVMSMSRSVSVPEKLDFAGETFNLSRYDLHERFDREINGFSYLHSTTMLLLKKANRYFPVIEPILKANGIPDDFKYLAVIESNMNHRAVSPARAVGLWQIMPKTGQELGLEVGKEVDERYSVIKSTEAACRYLKQAYAKYGSWADVALSYNAGQGRITNELVNQQAESGLDLWLVDETSRYFFRILAVKQVFENPAKYGFLIDSSQFYKPVKFTKVKVESSIADLATFAKEQGVSYAQLKDFNSWLRTTKLTISPTSKKTYTIYIPTQESLYYKKGEKVKVHSPNWASSK